MLCQDIMHLFSEGTLVAVVPEYVDLIIVQWDLVFKHLI